MPRRYGADGTRLWNGKTPEEFTEADAYRFMAETEAVLQRKELMDDPAQPAPASGKEEFYLSKKDDVLLTPEQIAAEERRWLFDAPIAELAKLLPMTLEEMCEELRKRPGRGGKCIKETTVQKYLETVSSVLEDAKKNDIIPFNPAHRVRKKHIEKEVQHIPQKYEMSKLMWAIQNEPILYRAYYTLAITTGLRRGELCALQWRDITGACELTVRRSRSCASGQIVESDTKSHRERIVTIPLGLWELLMALRQQQVLHSGVPDREQPIFTDPDGHVPHPDTFTRHLRKLYKKCGLPEEYHLHTLRHFYATYLLQEGTSKQVAASLLGHADTAFLERTYCHPQDVAKRQAANLMQDLLNNQNPCYVAFMKNKNRKAKKAG